MKRLRFFLGLLLTELALVASIWLYGALRPTDQQSGQAQLTQRLLLTDFALSTESRHTRHLNTREWIAPFQDFPAYLEHFPSSSFFHAETPQPD